MLWRLYDIKYEEEKNDLPKELILDLNSFSWSKDVEIGMMNLNFKAFRAIKEITGCVATSCRVDVIKK